MKRTDFPRSVLALIAVVLAVALSRQIFSNTYAVWRCRCGYGEFGCTPCPPPPPPTPPPTPTPHPPFEPNPGEPVPK